MNIVLLDKRRRWRLQARVSGDVGWSKDLEARDIDAEIAMPAATEPS